VQGSRTHSYETIVREKTYVWGSADVAAAPHTTRQLILWLRNFPVGEDVDVFTENGAGAATLAATLHPGDSFAVGLDDLTGVYGVCDLSTSVLCSVTI
jgi:hypothetical protein